MICNTYIQFFSTLADPTKLEILRLLREESKSVNQICEELGFEQSRVSHNLIKLKELGFIDVEPHGKQRFYSIDKKTIKPLLNLINKHVDNYYHKYCECKGNAKLNRWGNKNVWNEKRSKSKL